jgi:hypothetical protein
MRARGLTLQVLVTVCALAGTALALVPAAQAAYLHTYSGVSFGPGGPSSGAFQEVAGIATDPATSDVYVIARSLSAIYKFDASGKPVNFSALGTNMLDGSATPQGEFSFEGSRRTQVSVDASGGPASGDIYVTVGSAVDIFGSDGAYLGQLTKSANGSFSFPCGVAIDLHGSVYVADVDESQVSKFSPHANLVTNADYASAISATFPCDIAVDALGDLYVNEPISGGVSKYNADGEFTGEVDRNSATSVATNLVTNEVYVDHGSEVATYDSSGRPAGPAFFTHGEESNDVAVDGSNGNVYVSNGENGEVDIFDSLLLADITTGEANFANETTAVANGTVNPDGVAVTGCEFEYGTTSSYGSTAPCTPSPGSGASPVPVTATLAGLTPRTLYHFRLVVSNANGSNYGVDQMYTAPAPVQLLEVWSSNIAPGSATLSAKINPGGASTTYRFEYGQTTEYGASVPPSEGDAGASLSDTTVSVHLQSLRAATTYHFRLVATSGVGTVEGADQIFRIPAAGGAFGLPDGRQWEMVSPPVKDGAQIDDLGSGTPGEGVMQASEDGGAITYLATAPIGPNPAGNVDLTQLLSRRGSSGWSTQDIVTPNDTAPGLRIGQGKEYRFFTPDLSSALVEPPGKTPLTADASDKALYIRDNQTGIYRAVTTTSNIPSNTKVGILRFSYASPDNCNS